jgi:cytochrome bd-type quinol oxidase subunit 1
VSGGDTVFTLIGFVGLYFVLGLLFLYLVGREIGHGPEDEVTGSPPAEHDAAVLRSEEEHSL